MEKENQDGGVPAQRLLDLAAELKNISEACRRLGVDRSLYYRIKKGTATGVSPAAPAGRGSRAPSGDLEGSILRLCLEFPEWGCDRLGYYLTLTGRPVSSPTVQKILIRNGLGRSLQREAEARRLREAGEEGRG